MKDIMKSHWVLFFIIGIRTVWYLYGMYDIHQHPDRFDHPDIMFVTGTFGLIILWYTAAYAIPLIVYLRNGSNSILPLVLEFACGGSLYLFLSHDWSAGLAFYNFLVFIAGYLSINRRILWTAPFSVLVLPLLAGVIWGHSFSVVTDRLIDLLIVYMIGFSFCRLVNTLNKLKEMMSVIQQQNQMLELNAKHIEKLTLSEERNRLSRELHDTVGHTFIAVITGMDAVQYLIDASPEEAKRNLAELREHTRQGLDEVRQHIHQIAPDEEEQSFSRTLEQISDQFAAHTSLHIQYEMTGTEYRLAENVRITLIRFLQEALTNAVKHGQADRIHIQMAYEENEVSLKVKDNGVGVKKLVRGFGIKSLMERLGNINGTLSIQSSPQAGTVIEGKVAVYRIMDIA